MSDHKDIFETMLLWKSHNRKHYFAVVDVSIDISMVGNVSRDSFSDPFNFWRASKRSLIFMTFRIRIILLENNPPL